MCSKFETSFIGERYCACSRNFKGRILQMPLAFMSASSGPLTSPRSPPAYILLFVFHHISSSFNFPCTPWF